MRWCTSPSAAYAKDLGSPRARLNSFGGPTLAPARKSSVSVTRCSVSVTSVFRLRRFFGEASTAGESPQDMTALQLSHLFHVGAHLPHRQRGGRFAQKLGSRCDTSANRLRKSLAALAGGSRAPSH